MPGNRSCQPIAHCVIVLGCHSRLSVSASRHCRTLDMCGGAVVPVVFYWFLWLNMRITDRLDWIRAITGDKRLSSSTVRVGNYLAWAHNHSRGQLNPSIATIQENANVSRRAALYAIKSLVDAGYLEKRGGPKRGTRSDYILLLPSCPASTSADSAPVEAQTRAKIDTAPGADIAPLSGEGGCKNRHEPVQKSTFPPTPPL